MRINSGIKRERASPPDYTSGRIVSLRFAHLYTLEYDGKVYSQENIREISKAYILLFRVVHVRGAAGAETISRISLLTKTRVAWCK